MFYLDCPSWFPWGRMSGADIIVNVSSLSGLGYNRSSKTGADMYYWEPVGALISTVLSQMILGARVYAVSITWNCNSTNIDMGHQIYRQNKWVAALLVTVLVVEIVIGGYSVSTTGLPPALPGPIKPPCGSVIRSEGWLIAFWVRYFVTLAITWVWV